MARITMHYEAFGEGRPLVVIPGWPDDWRVPADYLEPVFQDRPGWRRLYLDLPGRGRTRGEPWITTNDQVLDVVLELLDRLIDGEPFALAGHSAGAHLARALVRERASQVVGLLQVVPELPGDEVPSPVTLVADPALIERLAEEHGRETADAIAAFFVVQTNSVAEGATRLMPSFDSADRAFLDRLDPRLSGDVDPPREPFTQPALFLIGRQDSVVGYRGVFELAEAYPRASIAILDRAGHGLPWEQERLLRPLVDEWLRRVEDEVDASPGTTGSPGTLAVRE